jgi:hypothetical protein
VFSYTISSIIYDYWLWLWLLRKWSGGCGCTLRIKSTPTVHTAASYTSTFTIVSALVSCWRFVVAVIRIATVFSYTIFSIIYDYDYWFWFFDIVRLVHPNLITYVIYITTEVIHRIFFTIAFVLIVAHTPRCHVIA